MPKQPDKPFVSEKFDLNLLCPRSNRKPAANADLTNEVAEALRLADASSYAEAFPTEQPVELKHTLTLDPAEALLASTHPLDVARVQELLRRGMPVSEIAESLKPPST